MTVEALIWIPFFFLILALITDASLAFYGKAQAFRVVQNGNRAFALRHMDTADEVETFVLDGIDFISPTATAETEFDYQVVTTTLQMPISDLVLFNALPGIGDSVITVVAQHYRE